MTSKKFLAVLLFTLFFTAGAADVKTAGAADVPVKNDTNETALTPPQTDVKPAKPAKKERSALSFEERLRFENKGYPLFDAKGTGKKNYALNRFRMGLKEVINPDFRINLTLQDFRFFEREPVSDASISRTEFETYVANLEFNKFMGMKNVTAVLGRQEHSYSNERIFGRGNWNFGRSWDGIKLKYKFAKEAADLFNLELKRDEFAQPVQVRGIYYFCGRMPGLEAFFVAKTDRNRVSGELLTTTLKNREVNTFGINYNKQLCKKTKLNVEAAVQNGKWGPEDHRANAFHIELKHDTGFIYKHALTLEYNQASGDSDPKDGKHGTFDNLYPMNHQKYGYMDYVSWQNMKEICIRNTFTPSGSVEVRLNFHQFSLNSPYDGLYDANSLRVITGRRDTTGKSGTDVGSEIDLVFNKKLKNQLEIELGICKFTAGDFIKNTTKKTAEVIDPKWSYLQILKRW